jgi:nicotinate-nucleotide adenylyltransferase
MRALKVGLLGGSFNPAHNGHLYISQTALRYLGLDEIWWLVSPQNPLKSANEMAPFQTRFDGAKSVAKIPQIKVSDFEQQHRQSYTSDTLSAVCDTYPDHHFVWLMGADNLIQIPHWRQWHNIFHTMPIAVFDRPGYTFAALSGKAARTYEKSRVYPSGSGRPVRDFADYAAPAWTFITHTKHKMSSTALRKSAKIAGKACSSPLKFPN